METLKFKLARIFQPLLTVLAAINKVTGFVTPVQFFKGIFAPKFVSSTAKAAAEYRRENYVREIEHGIRPLCGHHSFESNHCYAMTRTVVRDKLTGKVVHTGEWHT
jgi:hypothetical protein